MFKKTKNVRISILVLLLLVIIYQTYQSTNIDKNIIQTIKKQEEVSLNLFIDKYTHKEFSKIDVINDSKLIGYVFI
ncbi:MAG: hypothetical protein BWY04_00337 [candidate division CPR1 bacterium ADurb.Bin160]|uniref:Uncharacterized protein n=1 Tax=candidate division CPR1 bacterium ADurb.Bin160 TaxID=1852826 RepID=A0A1V5ZPT9_9BACT|nr:MAG: hypothetical protein BWY04_00337 [candidate division CPR1 bacterium ADurb.Bin160]